MQPKALIRCRCLRFHKADTILNGAEIKVAVCNGFGKSSGLFQKNLSSILDRYKSSLVLMIYENVAELLAEKQGLDIIFYLLTHSIEEGMEAISRIRQRYKNSKVIFVAESGIYLKDAYKAQPFRYLFLSDSKAEIEEALISAVNSNRERKGLALAGDGKYYYILLRDILYIEALGDEIGIFTLDGIEYVIRMPLKHMLFLVEDDFIRFNRQQIVNARHILRLNGEKAMLVNNENMMISGRERRNVAEKYAEYIYRMKLN